MSRETLDHETAKGLLPDHGSPVLDDRVATALEGHLAKCEECRGWVETRELLEQAVRHEDDVEEHPASELLALCAVRPEEVYEVERSGVREHLEQCTVCRQEVEAVRAALGEARPGTAAPTTARADALRRPGWIGWGSLAAGVAGLAVATGLLLTGPPERPTSALGPGTDAPRASAAGSGEELSGLELDGPRLIVADRSLLVRDVKVKRGSRVTVRVGEVAAFGDGFQISDGGALVVESKTQGHLNRKRNRVLR